MIDIKDIPAAERLKPLTEGLNLEIQMLDAEVQLRMANIKTYLNELQLAISEL